MIDAKGLNPISATSKGDADIRSDVDKFFRTVRKNYSNHLFKGGFAMQNQIDFSAFVEECESFENEGLDPKLKTLEFKLEEYVGDREEYRIVVKGKTYGDGLKFRLLNERIEGDGVSSIRITMMLARLERYWHLADLKKIIIPAGVLDDCTNSFEKYEKAELIVKAKTWQNKIWYASHE